MNQVGGRYGHCLPTTVKGSTLGSRLNNFLTLSVSDKADSIYCVSLDVSDSFLLQIHNFSPTEL